MFFGGDGQDGLAWTPSPSVLDIKKRMLKKAKQVSPPQRQRAPPPRNRLRLQLSSPKNVTTLVGAEGGGYFGRGGRFSGAVGSLV